MIALALTLFAILGAVAALHLHWAFGGLWPAHSPSELARTVIGNEGANGMPRRGLTMLVAGLIFAAGILPLLMLSGLFPVILSRLGLWLLVAIFLVRGALPYLLPKTNAKLSQPFQRLNYRYFSPLCIALGIGYLAFALSVL